MFLIVYDIYVFMDLYLSFSRIYYFYVYLVYLISPIFYTLHVLRDELVSVILLICIKFGIYVMMIAQTSQFYLEVSKTDAELLNCEM